MKFVHSCLKDFNSVCYQQNFAALSLHLLQIINICLTNKICQDDWLMDINLLIANMKVKFEKATLNLSTAHTIVELTMTITNVLLNINA